MRHQGKQFARVALRQRAVTQTTQRSWNSASRSPPSGPKLASRLCQRSPGLGMIALDLGPGRALEDAEGALAQAALGPRREAVASASGWAVCRSAAGRSSRAP